MNFGCVGGVGGCCLERQTGMEGIKDLIVLNSLKGRGSGGGAVEEVLCFK